MTASPRPLMVFEQLRCRHGERLLFDVPRLALSAGNAVVVTGANGVGKTTLLRMLAGLVPAGEASVDFGQGPQPLSPYPAALRARLTYVHQHPYLFRTSVRANLAYGLTTGPHRVPQAELRERVDDAIRWAGLQQVLHVPPERLSGGEAQRLALARARALQTDVLLLDEPTSNLDGAAREQVLALVGELAAEGRALLMVCHDRELINLPGVARWKLSDGRLEMRGHHAA
ncbi:ABC transporter ATP-binding protein [Ralstonia solanacearum]|uniref:ABC transporter ATP-binding protein n=1 Tax=Ralstonia solanacearum TaxID=305 RepID=UPI00078DBAE4|nr:energy-coupling factor ABC transporter ATP-binding protein [Ralstonia solanacearum]AMP36738.1 ABC transporter ATP-binding protein [Ralstonia solanacearum]AXV85542.1 ABC transporter ATP-binding protein [Ralstonia solanacearum]AXW05051.1 ABC transporter ATP-binding protein [Ralstonia solanacearum]AXW22797.1 ABC transporter ATP-binding protein [Ralstonia solanacearum]AXW61272.1 ABC transporter ATP-binding protein [Ralstonia solanacearum]